MTDIFWVEESSGKPPVCMKRKRRAGKRTIEFVGWGSRPLIEFLEAIGQDTTKQHSRHDVAAFITKYIKDNGLTSAEKKKKVMCDERLYAIFGKKSLSRIKVFEMLEEHFVENHDDSDSELLNTSEEEDYREMGSVGLRNNAPIQLKKGRKTPQSCFAAIVPENIKLIYLKRSLIEELLKIPESFESKITGSFVRMKSDPNDIYQKNRFQLQQVTGVEKVPGTGDTSVEIHLRVSNYFKDIPIHELSDDNFSEEEIVDLQDRIKAGSLKQLTIRELELKAEMLHVDITKHSIAKELYLLKHLIDRANEKGWRRELFEHLDRRKKLQTPSEVEKMLHEIPEVIAEEAEPEDKAATPEKVGSDHPPTIVRGRSEVSGAGTSGSGNIVAPSRLIDSNPRRVRNGDVNGFVPVKNSGYQHALEAPEQVKEIVDHHTNFTLQEPRMTNGTTSGSMLALLLGETSPQEQHDSSSMDALFPRETNPQKKPVKTVDDHHTHPSQPQPGVVGHLPPSQRQPVIVELSDDEDDDPNVRDYSTGENPYDDIWHYIDPRGQTQGPFSLYMLKRWSDANYFPPGFKVWRSGHTYSDDAILLADVLQRAFPPQ